MIAYLQRLQVRAVSVWGSCHMCIAFVVPFNNCYTGSEETHLHVVLPAREAEMLSTGELLRVRCGVRGLVGCDDTSTNIQFKALTNHRGRGLRARRSYG
jgi:hypothetical protein